MPNSNEAAKQRAKDYLIWIREEIKTTKILLDSAHNNQEKIFFRNKLERYKEQQKQFVYVLKLVKQLI